MMGVPAGGSGFAVEQKKKLLWGSKKVGVIGWCHHNCTVHAQLAMRR